MRRRSVDKRRFGKLRHIGGRECARRTFRAGIALATIEAAHRELSCNALPEGVWYGDPILRASDRARLSAPPAAPSENNEITESCEDSKVNLGLTALPEDRIASKSTHAERHATCSVVGFLEVIRTRSSISSNFVNKCIEIPPRSP